MSQAAAALRKYYIRDLETGTTFYFHAMPDDGINVDKSVNWSANNIQGRSSPIQGYSDSNPTTISLNVPIFSSIEQGDGRTVFNVKTACDFFLSLAYPDYQGIIKPPHKCMLVAGSPNQFFNWTVVCQSVGVSYLPPWDVATGLSHRAIVRIVFMEVAEHHPWDYKDIRGAASSSLGTNPGSGFNFGGG